MELKPILQILYSTLFHVFAQLVLDFFVDLRNFDGGSGWADVSIRRIGSKLILLAAAEIQSWVESSSPTSLVGVFQPATIR